ncbi:zinc finger protein 264-like isoform X2 [Girardinichthys multiradiatus]|uniref:zinc finger protein 264-like isoform X2 n=1 Tax=Girardinichthys multiradiatus TaxID=208333 RepID=UPI001FAE4977|nr:zinc finger protein 264-like isoform X2 [Girardinichthys multiradiatus]
MYRFLQTIKFGMEDNISQESLSPPSDKQVLPLPLTALRLLVPPLRLASAAIWQTVQRKVVADYGILEEFVSMVTDIIPELLTRHQKAQLTLGLRARLILALCHQENAPDCDLIEPHLDRMEMLIRSWLKEVGGSNPEVSHLDFVDLVKKFLSSPDEREYFFQVFHEDFGAAYDEAIHALMWLFLSKFENVLPVQTFHQVATMFGEGSCVLAQYVQSVSQCDELKILLQYHNDLSQLDHNDISLDGSCIISALKLPCLETTMTFKRHEDVDVLKNVPSCPSPVEEDSVQLLDASHMKPNAASGHLTLESTVLTLEENGTQLSGIENQIEKNLDDVVEGLGAAASRVKKKRKVPGKKLNEPVSTNSRPVRANRGLLMKKILEEEKRELQDETQPAKNPTPKKTIQSSKTPPAVSDKQDSASSGKLSTQKAPVATCSEDDSWSYYSEGSCQDDPSLSNADSWSYYSDDESSFEKSVSCPAESDSVSSCSNTDAPENTFSPSQQPTCSNMKASTPKKTRNFLCFICKQQVSKKLRAHIKSHFPNKDYTCPQCDTKYKLLSSLERHLKKTCFEYHLKNIDPDKPEETQNLSKCDKCGAAFQYKVSLQKHLLTHHELYCSVCRTVLRDAETLARHKTAHMPFQCTRCDQIFTVFKHLVRHYENTHQISRPFKCNHCPKILPKLNVLIKHEWQHTGRLPFQCAQCNLKFKSFSYLLSHEKVHKGEKPCLCSDCGKTFAHRSNLYRHLRLIHSASRNERSYSCSQCEKAFKEKATLIKHQRTKHLQQLFRRQCPFCGKMVATSTLARHKVMHMGQSPFKCIVPECSRSYRTGSELKRHVLVHHTNERPYKCDVCGKGFVRLCDLNAHAKIHSKERPFVCHICGKAFLKAYSMFRHKRLLHPSMED